MAGNVSGSPHSFMGAKAPSLAMAHMVLSEGPFRSLSMFRGSCVSN